MKRIARLVIVCALMAGPAGAQTVVPETGLAAEGEGRWEDALRIYQGELDRQPSNAALWLRVADIEAKLGHSQESIAALERAAQANRGDAPTFFRLSQAYAAAGHAKAALHAVDAALVMQPESEEYLRAHAMLATWAGEYDAATGSYRKLRARYPGDLDLTLALARVNVWAGHTDAAAGLYREYLAATDSPAGVWLELARAEGWRGNFAGALAPLREYQTRFGETEAYHRERAATLARAGRPREALQYLDGLVAASPDDYELALARTIALASLQRQGDALSNLAVTDALQPGRTETAAARNLLRSMLGSSAGPSSSVYSDSDGLRTFRIAPRFDVGFDSDTRVQGGYEYIALEARTGSGLDQIGGGESGEVAHGWAGLTQRVGRVLLGGTLGQARAESHDLITYSGFARFDVSDELKLTVERLSGFAAISPRTVALGLTRLAHRGQIEWTPAIRYVIAADASYEDLSDGNERWEMFVAPRVALARTERVNLDFGLLAHRFGATHDLNNGYYDPRKYEYYSVVIAPYWKASENVGVNVSTGIGGQRDDSSSFRLGGNASVEATFGIYERWLLKVNASATTNRRLESGAFSGYSGGVVLLRRF